MYHPRREMAQLPQMPQIENGKPDFSPTFQKVELRNSTFFQQSKNQNGRKRKKKMKKRNSVRIQ